LTVSQEARENQDLMAKKDPKDHWETQENQESQDLLEKKDLRVNLVLAEILELLATLSVQRVTVVNQDQLENQVNREKRVSKVWLDQRERQELVAKKERKENEDLLE